MFNPNPSVNVQSFWNALGTFYDQLPEDERAHIEAYWESLVEGAEASYHNLFQANLSQYFKHSQGYIDHIEERFDIIFDGPDEDVVNVRKNKLSAPTGLTISSSASGSTTYSYRITATTVNGETLPSDQIVINTGGSDLSVNPNYIGWDAVGGADSYIVYGRTLGSEQKLVEVSATSFADDGLDTPSGSTPNANTAVSEYIYRLPEGSDYMSIPKLIESNSNTTLNEGSEYSIKDLNKLSFPKIPQTDGSSVWSKGRYRAPKGVSLIPSLMRLYFPALGLDDPKNIVRGGQYTPHLQGYSSLPYFEKRREYAYHLTQLTYGLVAKLRAEPTINNLQHVFALLMDYPFAYEDGTVDSISGDVLTLEGASGATWSYEKPNVESWSYQVGDSISRFDILIDGINVIDYVENSALIEAIATEHGEIEEWDIAVVSNTPEKAKAEYYPTSDFLEQDGTIQPANLQLIDKSTVQ